MPLVGIILSRFDPRKLLALGMLGGAYSLYGLSRLNLNAGYWDFFWPQFFQGVSLSLMFVPLTTVTMDQIPREETGNATSLFNLMRNIGGSMGIAAATTMVSRRGQFFTNRLGENVNPYNPQSEALLEGLRQQLMAQGRDFATATREAYAAVWGMVQQQATMLSFLYAFQMLAIVFLVVIPLLLLMRKPVRAASMPMH
jgi:DHA2 family multidrug resistance protein